MGDSVNGDPKLSDIYAELKAIRTDIGRIELGISERVGQTNERSARVDSEIAHLRRDIDIAHQRISTLKRNFWMAVGVLIPAIATLIAAYIQGK